MTVTDLINNSSTRRRSEGYPIDPMPEGPLPAKYDLLIYAKNGHRPGLLEHLAELYSNHIQFHYGQYKRSDLIEAARRSRVCAYLADNDHGPLALQEILLTDCPTVGVRTGAPFVVSAKIGFIVDSLPPGSRSLTTAIDQSRLEIYLQKFKRACGLDRAIISAQARVTFNSCYIADRIPASFSACVW